MPRARVHALRHGGPAGGLGIVFPILWIVGALMAPTRGRQAPRDSPAHEILTRDYVLPAIKKVS